MSFATTIKTQPLTITINLPTAYHETITQDSLFKESMSQFVEDYVEHIRDLRLRQDLMQDNTISSLTDQIKQKQLYPIW